MLLLFISLCCFCCRFFSDEGEIDEFGCGAVGDKVAPCYCGLSCMALSSFSRLKGKGGAYTSIRTLISIDIHAHENTQTHRGCSRKYIFRKPKREAGETTRTEKGRTGGSGRRRLLLPLPPVCLPLDGLRLRLNSGNGAKDSDGPVRNSQRFSPPEEDKETEKR